MKRRSMMSVVLDKYDRMHTIKDSDCKCSICSENARYPLLRWNEIIICASCCAKVRAGFTADLIHCAAIHELQKLSPEYRYETLERKTAGQRKSDYERIRSEEEESLEKFRSLAQRSKE
jgi:hypothetical protein